MSEWRTVTMSEVMVEFHDGPHATPAPADDGPVFLGIKNISESGALDLSDVRHIAERDFEQWTRRATPQCGDVVFTYEATLHRYALIPQGFRGCLGRRLALIRPDPTVVLPRYLHFAMLGPAWRSTVEERVIAGSTVDRVPLIDFPRFPIDLPDLDTQAKVIGVLGAIDDLIENNRRRIALLEQMAQAIYREWFVHFRYPGHEDDALVDSPLGSIPDTWRIHTIGEIADINRAQRKPTFDEEIVYVDISSLGDRSISIPQPVGGADAPGRARRIVRDGDIAWSMVRPGRRGHALLVRVGADWIASTGVAVITPRSLPPSYLFEAVSTTAFSAYLTGKEGGAAYPAVKPADFAEAPILVPPPSVLEEYGNILGPIHSCVWTLAAQQRSSAQVRDLLLPKLVTGAIDVAHLDLDALLAEEDAA